MMPGLDAVAGWLLAVSWQLLPLTAVIIVLDFALRRAGPVVRSALWWVVLAKLIVPPGIASPLSIAQLWPADGVTAVVATASEPSLLVAADAAAPEARNAWHVLAMPWKFNRASGAAALLAVWAAGVIAAAVLVCWRYRRVRAACLEGAVSLAAAPEARSGWKDLGLSRKFNRASGAAMLLADSSPDVRDSIAAAVVEAARRLGLSKLPPIFVAAYDAPTAGLPAVIGFLAPCIVLPRPLLERPRVEIEHVLLHELAHVRRGDPLTSCVCLVAQIVFWFHPAIWCARRRLATLREMACDRTVARVLGDATPAYRRTLILLARSGALSTSATASGPGALGLFQRQSQLVTRLDALARPVSMRRATECAASAAIAAAILVSCVPLARKSAPAAPAVSIDVPPLDQLPGSLQKRYAVMRALALAEQAQQPRPSR